MQKEKNYSIFESKKLDRRYNPAEPGSQVCLTQIELHQLYTKELRCRYQKATVFWPGAGDRLLHDQINQLKSVLHSDVMTVFIPIINKFYCNFIVLERKKTSSEEWLIKKIEIPANHRSGEAIVMESMKILEQGLEVYSASHSNRVHTLDRNNAIYSQIEQALNVETDNGSSTTVDTGTTARSIDPVSTAAAVNLKVKYKSGFELLLEKLAKYEALGYSIEHLCAELTQILAEMSPSARESAIKRLALFDLAMKPAITRVIESYYPKQSNVFSNPHLFLPKPKFKSESIQASKDVFPLPKL